MGERFSISTKIRADKLLKSGRVSGENKDRKNKLLKSIEKRIEDLFYDCIEEGKPFTRELIRSEIFKQDKRMYDYMSEYIKERGYNHDQERQFKSLANYLNKFNPYLKFSDMSADRLRQFENWYGKDRASSTRYFRMKKLKSYVQWADGKGIAVNPSYRDFKPKPDRIEKRPYYLTEKEVEQVYNVDLPEDQDRIRDCFIMLCYTGLRQGDLKHFTYDMITDGYINLTTQKNKRAITVPLYNVTEQLLEKYRGVKQPFNISNQYMNRELKKIGEKAGLTAKFIRVADVNGVRKDETFEKWELLSTHAGRRTYINYLFNNGISLDMISRLTGSNIRELKPYYELEINTINKEVSEKINKINLKVS